MLKKHSVLPKLAFYGPKFTVRENDEAFADPEGLTWQVRFLKYLLDMLACFICSLRLICILTNTAQVMNAAWDHGLSLCVESALPCLDGELYSQILDAAKPRNDPDRHHASFFAYRQQPSFISQRDVYSSELSIFIKCMHG
jgi:beta-amylase